MSKPGIYERIKQRLDEKGFSERQASILAVGNSQFIRNIRKGQSISPRGQNIAKLARVLEVSESWLLGSTEDMPPPTTEASGIRYGGIVEAGAFRRNDATNQDGETRMVPLPPDPRYPARAQFAFEVYGDSMDKARMFPGMWVQAVDVYEWERVHGEPGDGRLVIAAHVRNGDSERELTVKRLRILRDRVELRPESTNPAHEPMIYTGQPQDDAGEVQIIAVVISAHWIYT